MGGFFGAVAHQDVTLDIFFGVDYHSHLGTRRGGMLIYDEQDGFQRQIHSIENTPFRTKFEKDLSEFHGNCGIGCISDTDPQPLLVRSHLGLYAITTVGIINNSEELIQRYFSDHGHQFMAMSSGKVNATELAAALINQKDDLVSGILHAQEEIQGSLTLLILTEKGEIIAARDRVGRLPVLVGKKEGAHCVSFESFAYHKLGYQDAYELGPREIVRITADDCETLSPAGEEMKICAFLWTYYGYPNSNYQGINVEVMRYRNGEIMARDEVSRGALPKVDYVAGVPDSGLPHAIGFANRSGKPFARPFVKYTPTWPRSFMPANQEVRNQVAKMKQIPVPELIEGKKLLFVDDSIVRGTQLRETVEFLYESSSGEEQTRLSDQASTSPSRSPSCLPGWRELHCPDGLRSGPLPSPVPLWKGDSQPGRWLPSNRLRWQWSCCPVPGIQGPGSGRRFSSQCPAAGVSPIGYKRTGPPGCSGPGAGKHSPVLRSGPGHLLLQGSVHR